MATFTFNGESLTVIDGHFTSKGGSAPLLGSDQPAFDAGEVTRGAQAQAVNTYIDSLQATNPNAHVVVAGDLNEFQFEEPINVLKGTATVSNYNVPGADPITATGTYTPGGTAMLTDLQDLLPANERFDYVFEGNAETLDHVMVSNNLAANAQFDVVHLNSEFFDQTSDHEPLLALLNLAATTQPILVSSSPADNATNIAIGANIVLIFDGPVKAGTGNIILRPATGADISIPVGNAQVTFNGNTVTINPTADLRPGVAYDVIIGSGVITDTSGNAFAGVTQDALDFTTSFTIPAGSFAQTFTIADPGTFTLLAGTTRTQTAAVGVTANVASGSATIDIEGTLNDTASGQRAFNATLTGGGQITVGAAGKAQSLDADTIRVLAPNAKVDFTNLGQVISGTTITTVTQGGPNPGTGFALNYNAVLGAAGAAATDYTSGGVITNGAVNNTGALIQSNSGDAIRLGSHMTLINYGTIKGNGPVNDSNNNNVFNSNPNDDVTPYDTSRGVRFNQSGGTAGKIENYGTIEGAQHAVDVGQTNITNLIINNYATGKIIGHNGSGVGADTTGAVANTVTVDNFGKIYGEYGPTFDRAGFATVDGDADGVDVDGAATIINHTNAIIAGAGANEVFDGTGAGGFDSNGRPNKSEGISIGGGSITNDGLISGADFGITVNNDSNPANNRSGVLATTIENDVHGEIIGQKGFAIRLENKTGSAAGDNDVITNFGTIIGNGTIPDPNGTVLRQDGNPDPGTVGSLDGVTYTSANAGNARFISGDGSAIQTGEGDDVLTNHGTITGNSGRAINLEGGTDTLNLYTEGTITGRIDGGAGTDTINLFGSGQNTLGSFINFEAVDLNSGDGTLGSDGFATLALGSGAQTVRFAASTLADGNFGATIIGIGFDDQIDLKGIGLATTAQLGANNLLTISGGSVAPVTLQLDPNQSFSGDVFKLISDGAGGTIVTVITNGGPIALDTSASGAEDSIITGQVSANDADNQPSPLIYSLVSGPQHGQLTLFASGGYNYTPDANYNGLDSFTFKANDGILDSNTAMISLTVNPVNDAPTATNLSQSLTLAEDATPVLLFATAPVIFDIDNTNVTATLTLATSAGVLVGAGTGVSGVYTITGTLAAVNAALAAVTYDSAQDFNGTASVTVAIDDGHIGPQGTNPTGAVSITVTAVNDPPVNTLPATFSTAGGVDHAITGLAVSDIDSASLTTTLHVEHGTLTIAAIGGAVIGGSGTGTVTLTGSVAQINAAFAAPNNVIYHGAADFGGTDFLTMTSDDGGSGGTGSSGVDTVAFTVSSHADLFTAGNDTVILPEPGVYFSLGGNDTLFMTAAGETAYGGPGNDSYHVEATGTTIVENANEGIDTVQTAALASYTLGDNVENLTHTGNVDFTGIGNALNNVLIGGTGNDYLIGFDGNDTLIDGIGLNTLQGGKGNDIYAVQSSSETVFEFAKEGTDQVQTFLPFYHLPSNVENLTLVGSGDHTGIGNELNNVLIGGTGNDYLIGLDGNDTLIGGSGGLDTLQGGKGDDIYAVQSATDTVFEFANEGNDEVQTFLASYTLPANLDRLTFVGAFSHTGTGNELANTFTGSSATDTFTGAGGNDVFNYRVSGNGLDIITDFNADNSNTAEHDHIDLHGRGLNFAALAVTDVAGGVTIGIPGGDAIHLKNVNSHSIDAGDFFF